MSSLEQWLINAVYILCIIFFVVGWIFYLRMYYARTVIGKALVEFITPEGNTYFKLIPVIAGFLYIAANKKRKAAVYAIKDIVTNTMDYPMVPGFLSIIQTKVKKTIIDEETLEPLTNRTAHLLASPHRFANVLNQQYTEVGVERAEAEYRDDRDKERGTRHSSSGGSKSSWMWVIILAIIAVMVVGGFYLVQYIKEIGYAAGI